MIGRCSPALLGLVLAMACTFALLAGCGGGEEPLDQRPTVTTQPVDCGGGITCK